jgi:hypothetical protein
MGGTIACSLIRHDMKSDIRTEVVTHERIGMLDLDSPSNEHFYDTELRCKMKTS